MRQHSFVIEAEADEGIGVALAWVEKELGVKTENNPDISVLRYGLFSVADARRVTELAAGVAFAGESKVVIISASRAYHEAQNALLKVFEEPPAGTYLFLIMPSLGGLLPTLRSRVQVLSPRLDTGCPTAGNYEYTPNSPVGHPVSNRATELAREFLGATKEKRSAIIKKLASGKDDDERRAHRDEAIALINSIEVAARNVGFRKPHIAELLSDIATLRTHLYDRSAPVKMILEHLALVIPKGLV